jgi:hypothetical protein
MYSVCCDLEWSDEWRAHDRSPLDAEAQVAWKGHNGELPEISATVLELSQGGLSFVCAMPPKVGDALRIRLGGLWLEAIVRNVCRQGHEYRVGAENT